MAYLVCDNRLLESWPAHRNRPRILTPRPDALEVGRLRRPQLLGVDYGFLQRLVERADRRRSHLVGLGYIGLCVARDGVVGGHLVAGCSG